MAFDDRRHGRGFDRGRGGHGGGFRRFPREMHKTTCSNCGKECEVPFKPTEGRPVYCRECFIKSKEGTLEKKEEPAEQPQEEKKEETQETPEEPAEETAEEPAEEAPAEEPAEETEETEEPEKKEKKEEEAQ